MIIINIFKWFFIGLITIITTIPKYFITGLICFIIPSKGNTLKYKNKPVIPMIILGLSLTTYYISVFLGTRLYVQKLKINYYNKELSNSVEVIDHDSYGNSFDLNNNNLVSGNLSHLSTNLNELVNINSDTVGWIQVNNTKVNSSIVQTTDNNYYLKHDIYKNYNYAGWIYGDYRDNFKDFGTNTILYGHNMLDRSVFGSLVWCLEPSWYQSEDNQYIRLSTLNSDSVFKIFSIYTIIPEVYYLKTYFNSDSEHQEFLDTIQKRSIYDFKIGKLNTKDKILTLSTCNDTGSKRIVIHAKLVNISYK